MVPLNGPVRKSVECWIILQSHKFSALACPSTMMSPLNPIYKPMQDVPTFLRSCRRLCLRTSDPGAGQVTLGVHTRSPMTVFETLEGGGFTSFFLICEPERSTGVIKTLIIALVRASCGVYAPFQGKPAHYHGYAADCKHGRSCFIMLSLSLTRLTCGKRLTVTRTMGMCA